MWHELPSIIEIQTLDIFFYTNDDRKWILKMTYRLKIDYHSRSSLIDRFLVSVFIYIYISKICTNTGNNSFSTAILLDQKSSKHKNVLFVRTPAYHSSNNTKPRNVGLLYSSYSKLGHRDEWQVCTPLFFPRSLNGDTSPLSKPVSMRTGTNLRKRKQTFSCLWIIWNLWLY